VANDATQYLLSAQTDNGIEFFIVQRESLGLHVREASSVDGRRIAILTLIQLQIEDTARIVKGDLRQFLAMQDRATVVACAEQVGSMKAELQATIDYTRTRQQFGQPLAENQVVRYRLAEMSIACEEAIQLHGGMCVTDELSIAHYPLLASASCFRRMVWRFLAALTTYRRAYIVSYNCSIDCFCPVYHRFFYF
jgi:alkylation response protein AidB-like acyl-CoA dehydrogenase